MGLCQALQPSAEPLVLYPFRFRDPMSGKWVRARYKVDVLGEELGVLRIGGQIVVITHSSDDRAEGAVR